MNAIQAIETKTYQLPIQQQTADTPPRGYAIIGSPTARTAATDLIWIPSTNHWESISQSNVGLKIQFFHRVARRLL